MRAYLLLLPSGPDKVHKFTLRGTQPSTPLTCGRPHKTNPLSGIDPAIADCRLQDTATSPSSTVKFENGFCWIPTNISIIDSDSQGAELGEFWQRTIASKRSVCQDRGKRGGESMERTLVIGSTCVDVVLTVERLPKTAEDVHILAQSMALGGSCCSGAKGRVSAGGLFPKPFFSLNIT